MYTEYCTTPSLSGYLFGDFPLWLLHATAGRNNHFPAASPAFWRVETDKNHGDNNNNTTTTSTTPPAAIITTRWGTGNSSP